MKTIWKPHATVAAVVERDGLFLLVEEETAEGRQLNQPAGHLEPGESLLDAVRRETLEESGYCFAPDCLSGVYRWVCPANAAGPSRTYLRFAFGGSVEALPGAQLDEGIIAALWLSPAEICASVDRHRSPLVLQCVQDYLAGRRYGLELLSDL